VGQDSRFDVDGRVAIVTGATKGLGRAFARALAAAGSTVVVSGRRQETCDQAAAELRDETGGDVRGQAWHAGDWDSAAVLVDRTIEWFGQVDVLVNNAGINPGPVALVDMTESLWDKVLGVNLRGPMRLSSLVAPRMGESGGGSIINVSSVGAYRGGTGNSHYAASKAALLTLTQSMAAEWAHWGVRVNAISPGPFLTPMTEGGEHAMPGFLDRSGSATMLKRVADPDECAGAVLYLASNASSFVTGEDHVVSGGLLR
jgi:NAD(P)-dependent dehydrogenase (short-subunit alcohol dehydrogenase family)